MTTKTLTPLTHPIARGPRPLPFFGNLFEWRRDPLAFLETLKTYGDVARFKILWFDMLIVQDPALIEEVLVKTNDRDFARTPPAKNSTTAQLFGNGLLTSVGETWRRQRRLAQPAFHKQRIAGYADTMVAEAQRLAATWRDGETRNFHHEMMQVTLRIVVKTLFGTDLGADEARAESALNAVMTAFGGLNNSLWLILQSFGFPTPAGARYLKAVQTLDEMVYAIIARRRENGAAAPDDLLSMLMQAQDDEGNGMSDRQLRDEVTTMFVAGHETTALALMWALYLLATHPDAARRLQEELDSVLKGSAPTLETLPALRYTDAVVKETMRFYPPAWIVDGRLALHETQLGGYTIPKGAVVGMSQWLTHRDARYFPDPLRFRPERWLDGSTDGLPRYAYFPFGGGQRQCIGNTFAVMEANLLLATFASLFEVEKTWQGEPTLEPAITLRPKGGLPLRIRARRP